MRWVVILLASALVVTWNVRADGSDAAAEAQRFSQMYFAPMDGANFFRLFAPGTGMVEFRKNWRKGGIDGAGGWSASASDGDVTVREPGSRAAYTFRKGRPFSMVASNGKRFQMEFDEYPAISGEIPPMWEGAEEEALQTLAVKWSKSRLSLFYVNPNHAAMLLAELALIGLFVFLYGRRKVVVSFGAVGFAVAALLLARTDGRGGMVGLAAGSALLLGIRLFRRGGKVRIAIVSALAVAAIAAFFFGAGLGGRFSLKAFADESTAVRLEKWRYVPRMMVDSPHGWGATPAGRAYSDWYQPLSSSAVTPTLDSDHLTYMTGFGWVGRFAWGFAWLALLLSLLRFSANGGSPLPLAVFSALGLAAMFNPLLHVWTLWIVPVASLWPFAASRPWKAPRGYALPLVASLVATLAVCTAFYLSGRGVSRLAIPSIFTDGRRVFVGSRNPHVWIADDRYTIGWLFAPKEIRHFYSAYPTARPLGYVQKLSDVPSRVRRLAVAGNLCREYVKLWNAGVAPAADELLFLSPGMPLDAVPEGLRKSCRFAMVVGEFAARYESVYGHLGEADEVVLTEGAEVYLPGWVGLILSM